MFSLAACSSSASGASLPSPTPIPLTVTPLPPTEIPRPLAALVNGEGISLDEFNAELARYKSAQTALGNTVSEQDAAKIVLDNLIAEYLLAQGAAEAGLTLTDADLQARVDSLTAQLGGADKLSAWQQAHGYSDQDFRVALKRSVATARMRDKIISAVPGAAEQVHVRQILLYNEDVAQNIWNRLQAGADFDEITAQIDPATRGDIGWFPRGYLTEKTIEDAAFSLEVGKYSAVIKSQVGFHILKVIERQADRLLSPDALLTLQNRALTDWLANRRQQSNIVLTPK
jgi:parvulin-like peptidyl-prolyl isomerase